MTFLISKNIKRLGDDAEGKRRCILPRVGKTRRYGKLVIDKFGEITSPSSLIVFV
jgi:hypothetical protein